MERAQQIARERGQQRLTPEHLLAALLDDPEGLPVRLLEKSGADRGSLARDIESALAKQPKVQGARISISIPPCERSSMSATMSESG